MASSKGLMSMKSGGGGEVPENIAKILAERKKKQTTPMLNPKEEAEAINKGKTSNVYGTASQRDSLSKENDKTYLKSIAEIGYARIKKS